MPTVTPAERFNALVVPHLAALFRTAYRLVRNRPDAEDLVQETCIAAFRHVAELAAAGHPERWLVRVLYNRFVDGTRQQGRARLVAFNDDADPALASSEPSPEEILHQTESEGALGRAFLALDAPKRVLLALRAEGYGLTEIAEITGVEKSVLRVRLHRARRALDEQLHRTRNEDAASSRRGSTR